MVDVHGVDHNQWKYVVVRKLNKETDRFLLCPTDSFFTNRLDKHLTHGHKMKEKSERDKVKAEAEHVS